MEKRLFEILTTDRPFRYERKFIVEEMPLRRLEHLVRFHPAVFSEIFHERKVNNIYFDTPGFHNYFDNVEGVSRRLKMRIRWYGDTFGAIEKPVLEMKIKDGLLGTKLSYPLQSFPVTDSFHLPEFKEVFDRSGLPPTILELTREMAPTLINSYRRRYYMSSDKCFRITIDKDMRYYKVGTYQFFARSEINAHLILELKYVPDYDELAREVSTHLPFRLSKSSKYVTGFERLYL